MHKHLPRLDSVWIEPAIYFVTTCTKDRRRTLNKPGIAEILVDEWRSARTRYGWSVGRYVIMPDHVHFFCAPQPDSKPLSDFVGGWKSWTSRRIHKLRTPQPAAAATVALWQREFFDHVLRSSESYGQKWDYVKENPVRACLVNAAENWPFSGELEVFQL